MNVNRQIIILEKLIKDSGCTIKQLSLLCDVSYKTIQNDIKDINDELKKSKLKETLTTQRGIGVMIENFNIEEMESFINDLKDSDQELPDYDKEYYTLMISFKLLCRDYLKIDDLCEELLLSRSVVNELLTNTRKLFQKWEIEVNSRPHYGLYIDGLESDIRRFMFENLVLKNESEVNELLDIEVSTFFSLRESIVAIIRNFDVSINDSILEQLLLYIEVMTIRLVNEKTLNDEELHLDKASFEYILSEKIARQIESYTRMEINKSEVSWICRFIIGKCLKKTESDLHIDYEIVEKILPDAIAMIKESYGYDFSKDIDLYTSMSIHLNTLLKRAKIDNYLINPMLDDIKTYSLLAYDMATDVSLLINEVLGVKLPDDEISFFAIYLHLAIERQKQQIVPRKALVVCPSGKGMSEMVAHYVRKQFGEYISELKTCGYFDLDTMIIVNMIIYLQ
jgi:lichenan operon transcriptional antiterminator